MRLSPVVVVFGLLLSCSGDSQAPPQDLGGAPADAAGAPSCRVDADCRLFASFCSTAPCRCIPLRATDRDPVCTAMPVSCLVDPCDRKTAACDPVLRVCAVR